jgi:hypothetical protein
MDAVCSKVGATGKRERDGMSSEYWIEKNIEGIRRGLI